MQRVRRLQWMLVMALSLPEGNATRERATNELSTRLARRFRLAQRRRRQSRVAVTS
jgi:hypothetical protein